MQGELLDDTFDDLDMMVFTVHFVEKEEIALHRETKRDGSTTFVKGSPSEILRTFRYILYILDRKSVV